MLYYIIANGHLFDIVKVLPADDANFQQDYGQLVQDAGPDKQQLLHRFAAKKATATGLAGKLQPKLSKVKACYKNHQVLQVHAYYRLHVGWIPCSRRHPVTDCMLTWPEQLAIAIIAGATRIQLAMVPAKSGAGRMLYADFSLQEILQ